MLKRLFVFCDGTGNSPEAHTVKVDVRDVTVAAGATNVERLRNILVGGQQNVALRSKAGWDISSPPNDPNTLVYYDRGLGAPPSAGRPRRIHNLHSQLMGFGITENVIEAYDFLATNYEPNNTEIFLFGFSRGAYTIRLLVSMLDHVGLVRVNGLIEAPLKPGEIRNFKKYTANHEEELEGRIKTAFNLYDKEKTADANNEVTKFIAASSQIVDVNFLGLWDTVRGHISRNERVLINPKLSPIVVKARHAIAIDERRKVFKPQMWITQPNQDSQQVWFPGAHADVGGGYQERGLSDISLQWMIDQAGLGRYSDALQGDNRLQPDPLAPQFDSLNGPVMESLPLKWSNATKKYYRPVLQSDIKEFLHSSVFARYGNDEVQTKVGDTITRTALYRPANLAHIFLLFNNLTASRGLFQKQQNVGGPGVQAAAPEADVLQVAQPAPQVDQGEQALQQFDQIVTASSSADSWSDVEEDPNLTENRDKLHQIRLLRFGYRSTDSLVPNKAAGAIQAAGVAAPPPFAGRPQIS